MRATVPALFFFAVLCSCTVLGALERGRRQSRRGYETEQDIRATTYKEYCHHAGEHHHHHRPGCRRR